MLIINGEANGKIKEFIFSSLIFDGEYSNGKRIEKGKNIFFDDNL